MTKYHISYVGGFLAPSIRDEIIDIHPLIWRSQTLDRVLISWNEIPTEIENQIEDLEKERQRLNNERITKMLEKDLTEIENSHKRSKEAREKFRKRIEKIRKILR